MTKIGKVTVGATTHQTVSIRQPQKTSISNPNLEIQKPVLSLSDLQDITTANVQDGYSIVFNAETGKYEASPITSADIVINTVTGGIF